MHMHEHTYKHVHIHKGILEISGNQLQVCAYQSGLKRSICVVSFLSSLNEILTIAWFVTKFWFQ